MLVCYIKHEQMVSNILQLKRGLLFSLYRTSMSLPLDSEIYSMYGH